MFILKPFEKLFAFLKEAIPLSFFKLYISGVYPEKYMLFQATQKMS